MRKRSKVDWPSEMKDCPAKSAAMALGNDDHGAHRRQLVELDRRMLDGDLGHAEIALSGHHPVEDGARGQAEEREIELRPRRQEGSHEARQETVGEGGQGGDAQGPRPPLAQFDRRLRDAVETDEGALDLAVERMRLAGRHQTRPALLEEAEAEGALQVANEPTHRRLRHADHLRRRGQAAGQHHGPEGFQLARIEHVMRSPKARRKHNIYA